MKTRVTYLVTLGLLVCAAPALAQWTWTPETGRLVNLNRMPKETPELQVEFARSLLVGNEYNRAFDETNKFIKFYGDTDHLTGLLESGLLVPRLAPGGWFVGEVSSNHKPPVPKDFTLIDRREYGSSAILLYAAATAS